MESDNELFSVDIDQRVHKDISKLKLPQNLIGLFRKRLVALQSDPRGRAKRLKGIKPALWRVEVAGDLRIIYGISTKTKQIKVLALRWRRSDTYEDLTVLAAQLGAEFDDG